MYKNQKILSSLHPSFFGRIILLSLVGLLLYCTLILYIGQRTAAGGLSYKSEQTEHFSRVPGLYRARIKMKTLLAFAAVLAITICLADQANAQYLCCPKIVSPSTIRATESPRPGADATAFLEWETCSTPPNTFT